MRMHDLNPSNWNLDKLEIGDNTTSIIIFVVVALIVLAVFRKVMKWAILIMVAITLFYLFAH